MTIINNNDSNNNNKCNLHNINFYCFLWMDMQAKTQKVKSTQWINISIFILFYSLKCVYGYDNLFLLVCNAHTKKKHKSYNK